MHDLLYTFTEMRFAVMNPKDLANGHGTWLSSAASRTAAMSSQAELRSFQDNPARQAKKFCR
jgi:hypothetical protein